MPGWGAHQPVRRTDAEIDLKLRDMGVDTESQLRPLPPRGPQLYRIYDYDPIRHNWIPWGTSYESLGQAVDTLVACEKAGPALRIVHVDGRAWRPTPGGTAIPEEKYLAQKALEDERDAPRRRREQIADRFKQAGCLVFVAALVLVMVIIVRGGW